ncbi:hypothetical protein PSM36_1759 [Proteiniphilum saccharofermentans]|uniref:Uncharacterized protein n=1 Tax=Proteiniphilum saccharofermentans TaxID=1642647 RepID=A0A1R3T7K2_9BACT|nr:hypothetical protein PSM36_1759 [Proteiniphilum saccharofermentans]
MALQPLPRSLGIFKFQFYLVRLMESGELAKQEELKFQFYLVRLMEPNKSRSATIELISILPSTINGQLGVFLPELSIGFQFYLVRLMGVKHLLSLQRFEFQFYLVRLMGADPDTPKQEEIYFNST